MLTFSLQSGSNGNSIYVEAGDVRLLFDAGISGRQAEQRMRVHKRQILDVDAVIISHDHADHVRCAGVYQRKFKLPIYMTRRTHHAIYCNLGPINDVRYFKSGERLWFDGVTVHTIKTPHDAADGVAFIVEHDGRRLGIFTDLGHPFDELRSRLSTLHALYIESNYDPDMLETGPYPRPLKDRIKGKHGHISNLEAAQLLHSCARKLKWAAISHLSEQNNHPELAMDTHRRLIGKKLPIYLASRYDVSRIMKI
ncbi:MAG: MBL fold metallo-hydrolase [Planctomycetota bacterium]|nr:MAG: MBL fold metallo-hydrolase [Planctomycetota bacterium]